MKSGKKFAVLILVLVMLTALTAGLAWHMKHYRMVDLKFYPKDAQLLDLRGEDVSIKHYKKIVRYMPDCEVLWDVPFQGSSYPNDTKSLTVTTLTEADLETLNYFPLLQTVHAEDCRDYPALRKLNDTRPELTLYFNLILDGESYPQNATQIEISAITAEELALLPILHRLDTVMVNGGADIRNIADLQDYCDDNGIDFCVVMGNAVLTRDATQIRPEGVTEDQLHMLPYLKNLKQVHLVNPEASAETLVALKQSRIDLKISWEKEICGVLCSTEDEEINLAEAEGITLAQVEAGMAYFPNVKQVFLGECGIDNEELAAYRERSRDNYKVVWVVDLSGRMKVRTDIDNFMPSRDGWGYVREGEVDNIRYCEDLICIDLGHMGIKTVDFLEPLVNLEYLILAHTEVRYIDAVSNCKNLKYLELDWSPIKDLTPLLECKKLEDLNIGKAWPDITPVLQMTWLKNLYMIHGNGGDAWKCSQALPNTRVVASGDYTVSSGWRNLPNYYKMRDILGMHYM